MEQLSFSQGQSFAGVNPPGLSQGSQPGRAVPLSAEPGSRAKVHAGLAFQRPESRPDSRGNVTEIILPAGQVENFQLLLPMLTQLNQERRWLAWIDPPGELVSKWQKMHGIIAGEILVLRSSEQYPAQSLAERALSAGTCHAVVLWTRKLGRTALASLQQASATGCSHGVVLRQR